MVAHPNREDGITILETLIATMLLSVAALFVFSAFGIGLRAAALAGALNTATALAQDGVRRGEFGGLTYQEKINSYATLDDKIMFEMENHGTIRDMLAWSYSNPRFVEVKYADLIVDDNLMLFQ